MQQHIPTRASCPQNFAVCARVDAVPVLKRPEEVTLVHARKAGAKYRAVTTKYGHTARAVDIERPAVCARARRRSDAVQRGSPR